MSSKYPTHVCLECGELYHWKKALWKLDGNERPTRTCRICYVDGQAISFQRLTSESTLFQRIIEESEIRYPGGASA